MEENYKWKKEKTETNRKPTHTLKHPITKIKQKDQLNSSTTLHRILYAISNTRNKQTKTIIVKKKTNMNEKQGRNENTFITHTHTHKHI